MTPDRGFVIETADYLMQRVALHQVRHQVFVREQGVPEALEVDALDPDSVHVLARTHGGQVIGTGRLTPQRRIGRMAVAADYRGQGLGEALLQGLLAHARTLQWGEVTLHAQMTARDFYAAQGFLPDGAPFMEAGIAHQTMRLRLDGAMAVDDVLSATCATAAIIRRARRRLCLHAQAIEPDVWNTTLVERALRQFAGMRHAKQMQIVVHDLTALTQTHHVLLVLAQRLPSVFMFRTPTDPVDQADASACLLNDVGDYYARPLGNRVDGQAAQGQLAACARHSVHLSRLWDRSGDCAQLRSLGI